MREWAANAVVLRYTGKERREKSSLINDAAAIDRGYAKFFKDGAEKRSRFDLAEAKQMSK